MQEWKGPGKWRAKASGSDRWVYGWIAVLSDGYYVIPDGAESFEQAVKVEPKTVGRATGCFDINDDEIYEGDILGGFMDGVYASVIYKTPAQYQAWNARRFDRVVKVSLDTKKRYYIAGNVVDNPELLRVIPFEERQKTWEERNHLD